MPGTLWRSYRLMRSFLFAILLAPGFVAGSPEVDTGIELNSTSGDSVNPLRCDELSCRVAVVIFITTDCPIANRSAPEIERIRKDFAKKGVKMTLVHVAPDLANEEAAKHASDFSLGATVVVDRTHRLVAALGAQVTPEAFVVDREGRIRYRGRINDQFADYGARRVEPTTNDLRDAIEAVLAGRMVETPETEPIGCFIPELP